MDLRVCDLMVPRNNFWDVELIGEMFFDRDAQEILNILLPRRSGG